ncbi:MAG: hypothetical protein V3T58_01990 [Candidatus Hydrothermarchaeales archaeon]
MSSIDMILSTIAIGTCIFSASWTYRYWIKKIKTDSRSFDECINDIRAMNTYNSYFLAAIIVFLGFTIDKGIDILPKSSLIMLLAALVFAAFAIFFIPLEKPKGADGATNVKTLWLFTLVPSQWVVILCVFGIVNAVLPKLL